MSAVTRVLPGHRDLLPLAAAYPARYPGLLQSAARAGARARHDILFAFPLDAIRLDGDGLRDAAGSAPPGGFLAALDRRWRAERVPPGTGPRLPFQGGWLLYLGYELAGEIEPRLGLRPAPGALPVALALRCPAAIVVDHVAASTTLVAEAGHEHLLDRLADDLAARLPAVPSLPPVQAVDEDAEGRFLAAVARAHDYLRDGDTFQVNLSREWRIRCGGAAVPAALHAALRGANPAPFAALLQQDGWAIASSSPERLVEVRGREVQTRPIAGTRPRVAGEQATVLRELVMHPKERAEHVMLIDLERNDLGRVCVPGSVRVDELMATESYAHVHHIVSNVSGHLREEVTPGEVIAALFPGGTITGCPKVRCMEIIAELEGVGRGAYTGALGYLDRSGDMDLNILIRTLVATGSSVHFRAGAGIVADSVAEAELAETRAKARGLLRAFGVAG
ncbi:MAG: aminodeoxychorismate synthase component I [Xanthomonadales bacterium]|nr:aminodeoxychorismate synthase component I [Xanthomonadales bacterium]